MSELFWAMLALLGASGTFSGAEAALFTLGSRGMARVPAWVRPLLNDSVASLTVILFGNLTINLSYFAVANAWARNEGGTHASLIELGAVAGIVIGGEILPKTIAHRYPDFAARIVLPPVLLLHRLFRAPAAWLGNRWVRPRTRTQPVASADVSGILADNEEGMLDDEEHGLMRQLLELGSLRAGAIRRPLHKVPQIRADQPLRAAVEELRVLRAPWAAVLDGAGEVVGMVDLARMPRGRMVRDVMRPVPILPELAPVAAGVPLLRASHAPFVLLVDEYGHGTGVIERGRWADTLVDRLPDAQSGGFGPAVLEVADGRFLVDANLPLHDFRDRFGDPGDVDPRTETLLGFAEERLGRLLGPGDALGFRGPAHCYDLKVLRCEDGRPVRFELVLHDREPEGDR